MSRYWNPQLLALSPYVPGEQPRSRDLIKLNTNELPRGPSPKVLEALRQASDDRLRLYPDPESTRLRETWAGQLGLKPEQVFLGNGSDEVLAHTFKALFKPDQPLLFPDITYSFYPVYSQFFDLDFECVPLAPDFSLSLAEYRRGNGGIIFPNPNAPTGLFTPLQQIEELLQSNTESVVVVDEAYIDFGGESASGLIDHYPNLLVIQTLSKSRALAGLRVGAAFGQAQLIEGLQRVKNSFNSYPLGRLAEVGAVAALEDVDWFEAMTGELVQTRDSLSASLQQLGFEVLPSAANFVFTRHSTCSAVTLYEELRQRDILVRHFKQARIDEFLRISVGTPEQCAALLTALEDILA